MRKSFLTKNFAPQTCSCWPRRWHIVDFVPGPYILHRNNWDAAIWRTCCKIATQFLKWSHPLWDIRCNVSWMIAHATVNMEITRHITVSWSMRNEPRRRHGKCWTTLGRFLFGIAGVTAKTLECVLTTRVGSRTTLSLSNTFFGTVTFKHLFRHSSWSHALPRRRSLGPRFHIRFELFESPDTCILGWKLKFCQTPSPLSPLSRRAQHSSNCCTAYSSSRSRCLPARIHGALHSRSTSAGHRWESTWQVPPSGSQTALPLVDVSVSSFLHCWELGWAIGSRIKTQKNQLLKWWRWHQKNREGFPKQLTNRLVSFRVCKVRCRWRIVFFTIHEGGCWLACNVVSHSRDMATRANTLGLSS